MLNIAALFRLIAGVSIRSQDSVSNFSPNAYTHFMVHAKTGAQAKNFSEECSRLLLLDLLASRRGGCFQPLIVETIKIFLSSSL